MLRPSIDRLLGALAARILVGLVVALCLGVAAEGLYLGGRPPATPVERIQGVVTPRFSFAGDQAPRATGPSRQDGDRLFPGMILASVTFATCLLWLAIALFPLRRALIGAPGRDRGESWPKDAKEGSSGFSQPQALSAPVPSHAADGGTNVLAMAVIDLNADGYRHANSGAVPISAAITEPMMESLGCLPRSPSLQADAPSPAPACAEGPVAAEEKYPADGAEQGLLPFELTNALEGILLPLAEMAERKGSEFILDIEIDSSTFLVGDPERFGQLVSVAIKYCLSQAPGRDLRISVREERWEGSRLDLLLGIYGGLGAAGQWPDASQSPQASPGGVCQENRAFRGANGFRLDVAGRLAKLLGGSLWTGDGSDAGAILHLRVPFGVGAPDFSRRTSNSDRLKSFAGRRVLVVDDNSGSGRALGEQLARLGLTPDIFASGEAVLNFVGKSRAADYLFCCIDDTMPGMDGFQVATALRTHYGFRTPPLILLGRPGRNRQEVKRQFSLSLSKPITQDRLFAAISQLLHLPPTSLDLRKPRMDGPLMARLKGKRLLLVENTLFHQELIADFLLEAKVDLRQVRNGLDALLAVLDDEPDCILLDCHAPVIDGFEASARLRAFGFQRPAIIGLTNHNPGKERQRCLDAGMNDLVSKPIDLAVLLAKVVRWTTASEYVAAPQATAVPGLRPAPAAEADRPLPPLPPGLDIERGLRRLQGNRGLFLKALRVFRDSRGQQFQQELRVAYTGQDWPTCVRLALGLKNTAAAIGANEVALAAARLEIALKAGKYGEIEPLLMDLSLKLRLIVEGLARI